MSGRRPYRWSIRVAVALTVGILGLSASGPAAEKVPAHETPVNFLSVRRSERQIDSRIERFNATEPMEVIGATRAIYLPGTGLLFSMEVSLSPAVGISPFFTKMPPAEVEKIHVAKLRRVPALRELLLSLMPEIAKTHASVPDTEDIVMGATLFYFPYEKRDGLPSQMLIRAKAGELRKISGSGDVGDAARVSPLAKVTIY